MIMIIHVDSRQAACDNHKRQKYRIKEKITSKELYMLI